ncbi:uncharacterized protein EV422DRAFT_251681 [Fimicolochytrium jonesii]|uniref:uncharacterized protein n=1 Tax=Fimicolochytrium jonesii TaxID=1396493 RepID=UPI0022FDDB5C|nr:uncharacterized protein EV422DRAFT_251681 [Fimicolochytrium jonesii]KAI8825239.1 hypothetical protein EV422DRAFT_251681 [Fimicolochytrium jonesii]
MLYVQGFLLQPIVRENVGTFRQVSTTIMVASLAAIIPPFALWLHSCVLWARFNSAQQQQQNLATLPPAPIAPTSAKVDPAGVQVRHVAEKEDKLVDSQSESSGASLKRPEVVHGHVASAPAQIYRSSHGLFLETSNSPGVLLGLIRDLCKLRLLSCRSDGTWGPRTQFAVLALFGTIVATLSQVVLPKMFEISYSLCSLNVPLDELYQTVERETLAGLATDAMRVGSNNTRSTPLSLLLSLRGISTRVTPRVMHESVQVDFGEPYYDCSQLATVTPVNRSLTSCRLLSDAIIKNEVSDWAVDSLSGFWLRPNATPDARISGRLPLATIANLTQRGQDTPVGGHFQLVQGACRRRSWALRQSEIIQASGSDLQLMRYCGGVHHSNALYAFPFNVSTAVGSLFVANPRHDDFWYVQRDVNATVEMQDVYEDVVTRFGGTMQDWTFDLLQANMTHIAKNMPPVGKDALVPPQFFSVFARAKVGNETLVGIIYSYDWSFEKDYKVAVVANLVAVRGFKLQSGEHWDAPFKDGLIVEKKDALFTQIQYEQDWSAVEDLANNPGASSSLALQDSEDTWRTKLRKRAEGIRQLLDRAGDFTPFILYRTALRQAAQNSGSSTAAHDLATISCRDFSATDEVGAVRVWHVALAAILFLAAQLLRKLALSGNAGSHTLACLSEALNATTSDSHPTPGNGEVHEKPKAGATGFDDPGDAARYQFGFGWRDGHRHFGLVETKDRAIERKTSVNEGEDAA